MNIIKYLTFLCFSESLKDPDPDPGGLLIRYGSTRFGSTILVCTVAPFVTWWLFQELAPARGLPGEAVLPGQLHQRLTHTDQIHPPPLHQGPEIQATALQVHIFTKKLWPERGGQVLKSSVNTKYFKSNLTCKRAGKGGRVKVNHPHNSLLPLSTGVASTL